MRRQLFAFLLLPACAAPGAPTTSAIGAGATPPPDTGFTKPMFSLGGLSYTMTVETENDYFNAYVDTANAGIAIAAQSCTTCKVSPAYNPGGENDKMAADQSKSAMGVAPDGSPYSGKVFKDQVWIQGDFVDVDLVSISSATFFDPMVPIEGFIGFGPDAGLISGTDNYVTKLLAAIADSTVPNQMAFLPCAGRMWFAGFDPTVNTNDPMTDPPAMGLADLATIDMANPFFAVGINDFKLGTTAFGVPPATYGNAVIALGSSLSFVPTPVETKLVNTLNADPGFQALFANQTIADDPTLSTGCVTNLAITDDDVNSMLPQMTVTFPQSGGGTFDVALNATESYLYSAGMGVYCLSFSSSGTATGGTVFGATFLNGTFLLIDQDAKQVGFAPELACQAPPPASPRADRALMKPGQGLASSPYFHARLNR